MEIPSQAKFSPVEYVYALALVFERLGGVIVQQCRVINHQAQMDLVTGKNLSRPVHRSKLVFMERHWCMLHIYLQA